MINMKLYLAIPIFFFACIKTTAQHKTLTLPAKDTANNQWEFSLWGDYVLKPDNGSYFNPTFYADNKSLRIEGRYNYEALNTASVFAGWKFYTGKTLTIEAIPMLGMVFGQTNGVAPALEAQVQFKQFDFYSESEYVIDFAGKENSFFSTNTELAYRICKPVRVGLAALRTKLYQTAFNVQRGVFGEFYFGRCRAGFYYYDPFTSSNFADISFSVNF